MTDTHPTPDDRGPVDPDGIDPDGAVTAEQLAALRAELRAVAPLDELTRRRLVQGALAELGPDRGAATGPRAATRRRPWYARPAWVGAAAAVAALAVVGAVAVSGGDDADTAAEAPVATTAAAASERAADADAAIEAAPAPETAAGAGGAVADGTAEVTAADAGGAGPDAASLPAGSETTAAAAGAETTAAVVVPDLGPIADTGALAVVVDDAGLRAAAGTVTSAPPTTVASGSEPAACPTDDPATVATLVYRGTPAVLRAEAGPSGAPDLVVRGVADCAELARLPG